MRVVGAAARLLLASGAILLAGCAGRGPTTSQTQTRTGLQRYLREVEPARLGVNRLLEGADPILGAFREHRLSPAAAAARMTTLEERFAGFTVDVAAIKPRLPALSELHAAYAETYVLEDAYLSALASGLARGDVTNLPNTQAEQRAAIIRWRTGLEVLAQSAHVALPGDLQAAGRGEIAPSPQGAS